MPRINNNVEELKEPFREFVKKLVVVLESKHLAGIICKFEVFETYRTPERQKKLVLEGHSRTYRSKHIERIAVDIVPRDSNGKFTWNNSYIPEFKKMMETAKSVALDYGIKIECGGDWKRFLDYPHIQMVE